jgi:hypothetical protein
MDPMQVNDQIFRTRQASLDRIYYNSLNSEEEETDEPEEAEDASAVENADAADPSAGLIEPKTPPKTPIPAAPAATQGPTDPKATADPKAPDDPMAPTDTPPKGSGHELAGRNVVESKELMGEVIDIFENRKSGDPTGRSDIMTTWLAEEAEKRGLKAEIVGGEGASFQGHDHKVGSTLVITGNDGKRVAFTDTNGDGAIGLDDDAFAEAVQNYSPDKYSKLDALTSEQGSNKGMKLDSGGTVQKLEESQAQNAVLEDMTAGGGEATGGGAQAEAAAAPAKPTDPAAAIGTRIASGGEQVKEDGSKYKYQVQDCDLNKCPRGRPACTGCGQCIKSELKKIEKEGGSIEGAAEGMNGAGEAAETNEAAKPEKPAAAAKAEAPKTELPEAEMPTPEAMEQPSMQKKDIPEAASYKARSDTDDIENEDTEEALQFIQAFLDEHGIDKTTDDLIAEGQLGQLATQLGIQLPENISK